MSEYMITCRCSICNKVNDPEIATDLGDVTGDEFVVDPSNPMFDICISCFRAILEVEEEYDLDPQSIPS